MTTKEPVLRSPEGTPRPLASQLTEHVPALDGLRGLAILFVMLFHYVTASGFETQAFVTRKVMGVASNMWTGQSAMFTLSGFLVTELLLRAKGQPRFFTTFYVRRSLRILPVYYGSLVIIFGLLPRLLPSAFDTPAWQRLSDVQAWLWALAEGLAITYHNEDFFNPGPLWVGHLWSLGVGAQLFLIWPVLVFFCSRRALLYTFVSLMVLGPAVRFYMLGQDMVASAVYTFTLSRVDELAIGGILALLAQKYDHAQLARWARWAGYGCIAYLVASVIKLRKQFYWTFPEALGLGLTVLAIGTAALIVLALSPGQSRTKRLMESPWLRIFGKYGLGVYVLHTLIQPVWMSLFPPQAIGQLAQGLGRTTSELFAMFGFVSLTFALNLLLAILIYQLVERPLDRIRRGFAYGKPRSSPT